MSLHGGWWFFTTVVMLEFLIPALAVALVVILVLYTSSPRSTPELHALALAKRRARLTQLAGVGLGAVAVSVAIPAITLPFEGRWATACAVSGAATVGGGVYAVVIAIGEATWEPPRYTKRAATLSRRSIGMIAPWPMRVVALCALGVTVAMALVVGLLALNTHRMGDMGGGPLLPPAWEAIVLAGAPLVVAGLSWLTLITARDRGALPVVSDEVDLTMRRVTAHRALRSTILASGVTAVSACVALASAIQVVKEFDANRYLAAVRWMSPWLLGLAVVVGVGSIIAILWPAPRPPWPADRPGGMPPLPLTSAAPSAPPPPPSPGGAS